MERTGQSVVYLDTHIVCWLYEGDIERLSEPAAEVIESTECLLVSPMVDLELQYLYEIGRISKKSGEILATLGEDIGLQISDTSFSLLISKAKSINWTRDPFDRLITSHVMLIENASLVTRDRVIRENCPKAVW